MQQEWGDIYKYSLPILKYLLLIPHAEIVYQFSWRLMHPLKFWHQLQHAHMPTPSCSISDAYQP